MRSALFAVSLCCLALAACQDMPSGLGRTPAGTGPLVVFDIDARPFPDIPLPNDLALRHDPTSPTGRRLNLSEQAPTETERDLRRKLNRLTGFGTYQAVTISFDAPLDIGNLLARHGCGPDGRCNDDPADDAIWLVRIDRGAEAATTAPLDFGHGRFPYPVQNPGQYFPHDPHNASTNMVFETRDEDTDGNGQLDWGEDTDQDGVLDRPNLLPGGTDQDRELMTFYERETNTLILRPAVPLAEAARYAVVVTDRLTGADGAPVRSCFSTRSHLSQADDLSLLRTIVPALSGGELSLDNVAFAWTFTTQTVTADIAAIREGLHGRGIFRFLADAYPPDIATLLPASDEAGVNRYLIDVRRVADVIEGLGVFGAIPEKFLRAFDFVDYIVQGTFRAPDFMTDTDGIARPGYPADEDEVFRVDAGRGEIEQAPKEVVFTCAIPKSHSGFRPPFPVVIYSHGYTGFRLEMFGFAGNHARFGLATCAIDAFGHGMDFLQDYLVGDPADRALFLGLIRSQRYEPFLWSMMRGQARDLDNDGRSESGGDFWVGDVFHTRDTVRQSVADTLQFVRVLRACDGLREFAAGAVDPALLPDGVRPALACDFNGDGIADITGPVQTQAMAARTGYADPGRLPPEAAGQDIFLWGQSMGGIVAGVVAGVEPLISAAAPAALGAGLLDVGIRSGIGMVINGVYHPLIGPAVEAAPSDDAATMGELSFALGSYNDRFTRPFAGSYWLEPGGTLEVRNLTSGETFRGLLPEDGSPVRLPFAAWAPTGVEKRALAGMPDALPLEQYVRALEEAERDGGTFLDPGRATVELPADNGLLRFGDRLQVAVYSRDGRLMETIDRFQTDDFVFQNCRYPAGGPLVSPQAGLGRSRNSPEMRRLVGLAQMVVDAADPVNFLPRAVHAPLAYPDGRAVPVLLAPTAGDPDVPFAAGLAAARAVGLLPPDRIDPRYGTSLDRLLCDRFVYESIPRLRRYDPQREVVYDIDDLDAGSDGFDAPTPDDPVRATLVRETVEGQAALRPADPLAGLGSDRAVYNVAAALRVPYISPRGAHGFYIPDGEMAFDVNQYMVNLISDFFLWRGSRLLETTCLQDRRCAPERKAEGCRDDFCPWMPDPADLAEGR